LFSQPKTLLITLNTSWNIYNFRLGLLRSLQQQGFRVVVVAPYDTYSPKLEALGFVYYDIKMNNRGTNPLEDLKLLWDLYWLYRKVSPDAILHYTIKPNIYGSIAGGLLKIPMISNISGLGTVFLDDSLSSKVAQKLYKMALKRVDRVFFQNSEDRKLFESRGLVEASKCDLLAGSGINTALFTPLFSPHKERFTFLFVARLLRDKGLVEFVEASRMLGKRYAIACKVLGAYYPNNPTAIDETMMHAWQAEGVVEYLGVSDGVAIIMAEADCVVLPSYREGLSRVLLEAAAMEKPIVTTNVAGCKEVVEEGVNGYLCEVKSALSLAQAMERMLLTSAKEREAMGKRGRAKVETEFEEKHVIEKYHEALSLLIK
jgi:glycosyltransferase involved in cell wall biosynthesis